MKDSKRKHKQSRAVSDSMGAGFSISAPSSQGSVPSLNNSTGNPSPIMSPTSSTGPPPRPSTAPPPVPEEVKVHAPSMVVWVDRKPLSGPHTEIDFLRADLPGTQFEHVSMTQDVLAFLEANVEAHPIKLRVVTNFYRENDGGDKAAEFLIKAVRKDKRLKHVPVCVYCTDVAKAAYMEDKKNAVIVTNALTAVRNFILPGSKQQ